MVDAFQPTWPRGLLVVVVATGAFLLPQEAPLEYYPLNHPSDVYYLEITCQASVESETRIYFETGHFFNELQCIRLPIAPSAQPYTYTFPLWDAPLRAIRLEPLRRAGELLVTNMRLYTRSGREIKRFTRDDFDATHELAGIVPASQGWKFVTTPNATNPFSHCGFFPPIIPAGMNARNLQRCLLSWGYLAGMLWILLLAVFFVAQWRPTGGRAGSGEMRDEGVGDQERGATPPTSLPHPLNPSLPRPRASWRSFARDALFLAFLALLFSAVGNRGLIKDSIRYARFPVEPVKPGLRLEFDLAVDPPYVAQLFWDTGHGFNGAESLRRDYEPHTLYQTLRFDLPDLGKINESLHALRFDPFDSTGTVRIFGIRVVDQGRRTRLRLPADCLQPERDIVSVEIQDQQVLIRTAPNGRDPILEFKPEIVKTIAAVMRAEDQRTKGIRE
ncbi:MAG TPA: hypothetical protein VLW52_02505 [Opitutaceae bacterium]|nr:hypothetical protein [Opitutaceae bacterium]